MMFSYCNTAMFKKKKQLKNNKLIWKNKSSTDSTLIVLSEKVVVLNAGVENKTSCFQSALNSSQDGCEKLSCLIFFGCHFALELLFLASDGYYLLTSCGFKPELPDDPVGDNEGV